MSWTDKVPTDALKWVSVAAALAATATAEYNLAVAIGMHEFVAPAVPVALDAYVLRALQRGKEVFTSVLAMVGVNAASHLEHAGMIPLDWRLTTAVAAIAPLVLWRVHALKDPGTWRREKLWGESTEDTTEHERVPDETGDDGAREHNVHLYGFEVDAPDELNVPDKCPNCGHRWHGEHKHAHATDTAGDMHACAGSAWGGPCPCFAEIQELCGYCDELDVPDWLRKAQDTTRAVVGRVPVPPPVWDTVEFLKTEMRRGLPNVGTVDPFVNGVVDPRDPAEPTVLTLVPPLPTEFTRRTTDTTTVDTDGLNLGHVSHGRLHPTDTTYMERARFAFTEHGGGRGVVRHVKDALSVRSDRASRLVAACTSERAEGAL